MKLMVQIEVSHDVLDVATLTRALPLALESVAAATNAGIAATGADGMQVQAPGTNALAYVRFKLWAEETVRRIADLPVTPAPTPEEATP